MDHQNNVSALMVSLKVKGIRQYPGLHSSIMLSGVVLFDIVAYLCFHKIVHGCLIQVAGEPRLFHQHYIRCV